MTNEQSAAKSNSREITPNELQKFLKVAEKAARMAGQVLLEKMGHVNVSEKKPGDFVTQADLDSQKAIQTTLISAFPTHGFVGEESATDTSEQLSKEFCWIVDPLDGTTNFIHQLNSFSVSIALKQNDEIVVGVVFDPVIDEIYTATRGSGAKLNNSPIRVSRCVEANHSLLVCSFPGKNSVDSPEVKRFLNMLCHTSASIRRLGSAALNLSYVAAGRLDGYWATSINIWDVAAGVLILEEAGGHIYHIDGDEFDLNDPRFIATATKELYEVFKPHLVIESS